MNKSIVHKDSAVIPGHDYDHGTLAVDDRVDLTLMSSFHVSSVTSV